MTEPQAFIRIKKDLERAITLKSDITAVTTSQLKKVCEMAEKQIPKKQISGEYGGYYCPVCKTRMCCASIWCCHCGQKIDWSGE